VTETIVFGGGCFWCTEAVFTMLKGVQSATPGYAGGHVDHPTYEQVSGGDTGHIEVAKIEFNPDELSFEELLKVFFATHDPTTPNRQGNDVGPQYHSAIFYTTESQKQRAEHYVMMLQKIAGVKPIVTTIVPLTIFWPAEDYHKKYYVTHKDAPYCQLIIDPKVEKVQEKFKNLLK
jgi:peptide-methionine (S)-S-oxide reductase